MDTRKTTAEARNRVTRPPRTIEAILQWLTPRASRKYLLGDLSEYYVSPRQYLRHAVCVLLPYFKGQIRRSFNLKLVAAEACGLIVSFAGSAIAPPLVLVFAVTLFILVLREAHNHPSPGSLDLAFGDAVIAVAMVYFGQALTGIVSPSLALPSAIMMRGAALSLLMVSAARIILGRPPGPKAAATGGVTPALQLYTTSLRLNFLWMGAAAAIVLTNPAALPPSIPGRDFLLGALPVVLFGIAIRLQRVGLSGARPILFLNPKQEELERKRRRLFRSGASKSSAVAEAATFVALALPLVAALVAWVSGHGAEVDLFRLGFNMAALAALSAVWIYLRRLNQRAARAIQEQMGRRGPTGEK